MTVHVEKVKDRPRAEWASLSRVIACLINEKLVDSHFTSSSIILSHPASDETVTVGLASTPVFQSFVHASEIRNDVRHHGESPIKDGVSMMRIYANWANLDVQRFCLEMENSVENQSLAYNKYTLNADEMSPTDWEQALQEGHSLHPLNFCRFPAVSSFLSATVRFVVVDRSTVEIQGNYNHLIKQLLPQTVCIEEKLVVLPVHELQLANVVSKFPDAVVLSNTVDARPQMSVRTLSLLTPDFCIKVPLDLKILQLRRTMRYWDVMGGQRLRDILPVIESSANPFGGSLMFAREYAAVASQSKHLSCIIRESSESLAARTGDRIIVCATLAENLNAIWGQEPDKAAVLREYSSQLFRAVLPPILSLGLSMIAHLQNTLMRFDPVTREIKGFVIRDYSSMKVHRSTFEREASAEFDHPMKEIYADNLEDVYWSLFSSVINGHLSYFVRGLHPGLAGWRIVREEMEKIIPKDNQHARKVWIESPDSLSRTNVTNEIDGLPSAARYMTVPNPLYHCLASN
jgi:siderophore synthetase component